MSATLTIGAALLFGLLASAHCLVMCGGISAALGMATTKNAAGNARRDLLVAYQLGRVLSYALAGLVVGSIGHVAIAWADSASVRGGLRMVTGSVLVVSALALLGVIRNPMLLLGNRAWPQLSRLGRQLLPVNTLPRALGFGMIWGWMPCGFVYNVLIVAALTADPRQSAATMAAFGLGTLPAMLASAWAGPRLTGLSARSGFRRTSGMALLMAGLLTISAPWLIASFPALHAALPFDCATPELHSGH